jgi:hypothetical protein
MAFVTVLFTALIPVIAAVVFVMLIPAFPVPLCVNIDVASNKEVNYGIFKSSDGRRVKKSLAA